MKNRLNIFEYFNQKGALPIENNSTRNLGIVIKNNPIVFYSFLDLVSEKAKVRIVKPVHPDEWLLELQVRIKNIAKEDFEISNLIAITLTTSNLEFYSDENEVSEFENITDMIIYSKGTLIIIEAKRDNTDATNQLKSQISELKEGLGENGYPSSIEPVYISLTWDEIVERLNMINTFTEGKDVLLNDYVEHIKSRVPTFFPVQIFSRLNANDSEHIKRRIERFANSYGTDVNLRDKTSVPVYWVELHTRNYIKELAYRSYDEGLSLYFYPGNTKGQGTSLFATKNKLSILEKSTINIDGYNLPFSLQPQFKISDPWGKWKFDININSKDKDVLRKMFRKFTGRNNSIDNFELIQKFEEFKDIMSIEEFSSKFDNAFKKSEYNYTFTMSLTFCISFKNLFRVLQKIDCENLVIYESDKVVQFTKKIEQKIYELIEN